MDSQSFQMILLLRIWVNSFHFFLIILSVQRERNNLPDLIPKDVTVGTFLQDAKYVPISTYHSSFQQKWTLEAVKRALVIVFIHSYDYSSICLAFWCCAKFWSTSDYYPPSIGRFRVRYGDGVRIRQSCNHFNEGRVIWQVLKTGTTPNTTSLLGSSAGTKLDLWCGILGYKSCEKHHSLWKIRKTS